MVRYDSIHAHAYERRHQDHRKAHFGQYHERRVARMDKMVNWYRKAPKRPST